jgi:hypothetical protein
MKFGENINYLWKMKKYCFIVAMLCCACNLQAQNLVLNGSFENHSAPDCYNNFNFPQWNATVANSTQYDNGWVALLNDSCVTCSGFPNYFWGGGAQEGHWFATVRSKAYYNQPGTVWLYSTFSLALDSALKNTTNYKLTFYIKDPSDYPTDTTFCYDVAGNYIQVGVSNSATNFGTHLITTPLGTDDWQQYSVVFNTTNAEQHLTIEVGVGDTNNYVLFIDNFVIEETHEPATVFVTATNEMHTSSKKHLLKIVDILGKESKSKKGLLFYIYNDGTVEKKLIIE